MKLDLRFRCTFGRYLVAGLYAVLFGADKQVAAQTTLHRVRGFVTDSVTGRPLPGAALDFVGDSLRLSSRNDERGEFIVSLPTGNYELTTRRLGYELAVMAFHVSGPDSAVVIRLVPTAVRLAPVEVNARIPGLYGAVARYGDLRPLSGSRVQVIRSGKAVETESAGRYRVSLPKRGTYVIRVASPGYADQLVTVQVPDSAIEAVVLLDTGTVSAAPEALLQEFDERLRWQAQGAAFVSRAELRRYGGTTTVAVARSNDVVRRGLHFGPDVCLFVNGLPRPLLPLDAIPVEWIENVEVYTERGEVTNTLGHEWPSGARCGDGRTKTNGNVRCRCCASPH